MSLDLKKLRLKLPDKWAKTLSENLGLSESYVRKVLYGTRTNLTVVQAAIDLVAENKKKIDSIAKNIESL